MAEYNESQINSNETKRETQEIERINNETNRKSNEIERQEREDIRIEKEDGRLTDEQVRVNAENIRIANENERLRKEIERQNAEELRQIAYNSSLYARMDEAEDKLNALNNSNLYGRMDEAEDRLNEVDSQLAHNTSKLERKIYYCSSVADLIITDFKKGDTVKTLSYYSEANIGGGIYEITDKKDNLCLSLDNGLFAKLIVENELNIFCMGVTREDTNNNNAEIINRCASICIEKKHTLFMPYETIKINNNISLFGLKDINIRGVINCAVEGLKVEIGYYASGTLAHSYYYINNITNGTLSLTGLKRGYLQFQKAKVFEIVCDSEVSGKGSNAYNTILLGDCEEINITRHNDAWINENLFIGGRTGVLNMNTGHNNVFLKLCIENDAEGNGYYLSGNCADNKFIDARGEGYFNIQFGEDTKRNIIEVKYASDFGKWGLATQLFVQKNITDLGQGNRVSFPKYNYEAHTIATMNSSNYNAELATEANGMVTPKAWQYLLQSKVCKCPTEDFKLEFSSSVSGVFRLIVILYDENMTPTRYDVINAFGEGVWKPESGSLPIHYSTYDTHHATSFYFSLRNAETKPSYIKIIVMPTTSTPFEAIRLDLLYYTKANSLKDHLMFEAMKDMFK